MNWVVTITFVLSFFSLVNVGFADDTLVTEVTPTPTNTQVQNPSQEGLVGPEGGEISLPYKSQVVKVLFPKGILEKDVLVKVSIDEEVAKTYPEEAPYFDKVYIPDNVVYLGPQLLIEFPMDALVGEGVYQHKDLILRAKVAFFDFIDQDLLQDVKSEIRIRRKNNSEYLFYTPTGFYPSNDGDTIALTSLLGFIFSSTFAASYDSQTKNFTDLPEMLMISIQPINMGKVLDEFFGTPDWRGENSPTE